MRLRTDVAALPKLFDYLVPADWSEAVAVGTRVRVNLHGRRVGGWVVEDDVTPPPGVTPKPLMHWSGWGPPASVVQLAEWASWRWAGPISFFLGTASPSHTVRALPVSPPHVEASQIPATPVAELATHAAQTTGTSLLRFPPATDLIEVVLAVVDDPHTTSHPGGVLVLVPSVGWAERLTQRLTRRGYQATMDWAQARAGWPIVVGSRAAAWAPLPEVAAAVVLDAHDESYREESAPTYSAVDVVVERARRVGTACVLTSPVPPVALSEGREVLHLPVGVERDGWATLQCVDRRGADPRTGLFSEEFVRLARAALQDPGLIAERGPLVCVFNRTGGARLLACAHCGEVAQCTRCTAAMRKVEERLVCPRCQDERPVVCAACGRLRMKTLRAGVSRLREEVAALLGTEVVEVSGSVKPDEEQQVPGARVLMGTEAVLHRVRRAAAVAFLDIDLHLLAPRFSAPDETLALLVRSSRLVGTRHSGAEADRVLVQTRVPDHPLLRAVAQGNPSAMYGQEEEMRRSAGLPPFSALAALSGPLSGDYAVQLRQAGADVGVTVSELPDGRHLVRGPDHTRLCDVLAAVPRPAGRGLRIEVDPTAI